MKKNSMRRYIRKYWVFYLIAVTAMMISIVLDVLAPQITQRIIDDVIVGGDMKILMVLLWGLLGIGLGRAVFQYVKEYLFDVVGIRIACDMRRTLFHHIQKLSVDFFDKNNSGEILARVKDDVERVWNAMGFIGMLIIECTVHTILVLFCMFRINPWMTLIPLAILPVVAWIAVKLENKLDETFGEISEENVELNTVAQENLSGVRTVKSFAREDYEIEKFAKHNKRYYELNMKQAKTLIKYDPNISFLTRLLLVLVLVVGGILVIHKQISIGQLGAYMEYANNIVWPMELVGWLSNGFAAAMASNKKINKILAEEPKIRQPEQPIHREQLEGNLEFRHVDFSMHDTQILHDINFCLNKGKTLGIMGMTGSGKSSLVHLIQRFYDVSQGEILLDGVDIRSLPTEDVRKNTSVVMQDVFLFSDTIRENVSLGERDHMEFDAVSQAVEAAGAKNFVEEMSDNYETVIGERGVGLSGGQKQRISIARAIAKKAPILILDDSTSALDMETEYEIQQTLETMKDTTKIIIAHRISAVRNADEIIILDGGTIAERGTHEELMAKKGLYYATYEAQYGGRATCQ